MCVFTPRPAILDVSHVSLEFLRVLEHVQQQRHLMADAELDWNSELAVATTPLLLRER